MKTVLSRKNEIQYFFKESQMETDELAGDHCI